jgi:predicted transcriptional regulator
MGAARRGPFSKSATTLNTMAMNRLRAVLTEEDWSMLEIIGGAPLAAIPELQPRVRQLAATRLIVTNREGRWQLTELGQLMLDRGSHTLH